MERESKPLGFNCDAEPDPKKLICEGKEISMAKLQHRAGATGSDNRGSIHSPGRAREAWGNFLVRPATLDGLDRLPGMVNYLVGSDPSVWIRGFRHSPMSAAGICIGVDFLPEPLASVPMARLMF